VGGFVGVGHRVECRGSGGYPRRRIPVARQCLGKLQADIRVVLDQEDRRAAHLPIIWAGMLPVSGSLSAQFQASVIGTLDAAWLIGGSP
jgi:hypothetical protein